MCHHLYSWLSLTPTSLNPSLCPSHLPLGPHPHAYPTLLGSTKLKDFIINACDSSNFPNLLGISVNMSFMLRSSSSLLDKVVLTTTEQLYQTGSAWKKTRATEWNTRCRIDNVVLITTNQLYQTASSCENKSFRLIIRSRLTMIEWC